MLRQFFFFFFFNFVILAIFLKIMTKKCHKSDFLAKTHLFGQNFQKYCLIQYLRKKKFLELCLNMISSNFSILKLTQDVFFLASQKFLIKNIFLPFSQKSAFLMRFDIKNGFSDSFPSQKCIFYIHFSDSLKVMHMIRYRIINCFSQGQGGTTFSFFTF